MTVIEFLATLPEADQEILKTYCDLVLAGDKKVTEKIGKHMSEKNAILFEEQGIFKYALTRTKNHFTIHNMVMYGHPTMLEEMRPRLPKAVFQKGCINFKKESDFPLPVFEDYIRQTAAIDYMAIIEKYRKKK